EAVLLDLRLLQLGISERPFRVLKRLVVLGEIRPGGHLALPPLPAVPPRDPKQRHVVVARAIVARLRHERFKLLLRAEALERLPGGLASLRAPQQPRRQRVRREEEDVVRPENAFDHPHARAPRWLKNSGPCARPRTKRSTSSAAQRAEKLLSVAPSAIATRQRVGESEPRIAHASSYSDRAFPAFWQENASTENGAAVTG